MEGKQSRRTALNKLATFLQRFTNRHPKSSKDAVAKSVAQEFGLQRERSVYSGADFAIRFSSAAGPAFPNTVLSLSALAKYDHLPVIVCVVRPTGVQLLLANSTLIDKISHSSQRLSREKIRGSFNGTNILREFDGLENEPHNFESLFERHLRIGFEENYSRIVENTLAIRGHGSKFTPTGAQTSAILAAAELAKALSGEKEYAELQDRLYRTVQENRDAILTGATSSNVNLRGNGIEQIVTRAGNLHKAEDLAEQLLCGTNLLINIKSKLIGYSSNPAAYNIDKLLALLARGQTAFCFLFIGIDVTAGTIATRLVSFLDATIIAAIRIQPHWAGRNSRGGAQLSDPSMVFAERFQERIDIPTAQVFLQNLLDL